MANLEFRNNKRERFNNYVPCIQQRSGGIEGFNMYEYGFKHGRGQGFQQKDRMGVGMGSSCRGFNIHTLE